MADDDNLDLLLSMFDEEQDEEQGAVGGGGGGGGGGEEDNLDDLFDNDEEDGEAYVEPEEEDGQTEEPAEEEEEKEEEEQEESSHNRSKEDLEAELRLMQEKMQRLQEQLQASQGGSGGGKSTPPKLKSPPTTLKSAPPKLKSPPTTVKSPPPKPKPKPKPAPSTPNLKPKGASASPSSGKQMASKTPKSTPSTAVASSSKSSPPTASSSKSSPPTAASTSKSSPPTVVGSSKKPRAAHQPKAGASSQIQSPPSKSGLGSQSQPIGTSNALKSPPPTTSSSQPMARQGTPRPPVNHDVTVEKFSGLRLRRPRISSIDLDHKMSSRKMLPLSQLPERITRDNLEDSDWVTFAVLVNKITPQSKKDGKTFSIWKLNDLHNLEVYVSLFLFGNVHTELWKTDTGTVMGILNPNLMKNKEGSNSNEVALTIDHPQKVLILGEAMDFSTCKATKKNGDPCTQIVNLHKCQFCQYHEQMSSKRDTHKCQYCQYHVQAQYKKMSSKRAELQASYSGGSGPKRGRGRGNGGSLRERLCNSDFHYGGMSSLACTANANGPKAKKPTQSTLSGIVLRTPVVPGSSSGLQSSEVSGCTDEFKDLISMPTPGALNIKKHLGHQQAKAPGAAPVQSVTATELLKQQKALHQQRSLGRLKRAQEIQQRVLQNTGKTPPSKPLSNGIAAPPPKPLQSKSPSNGIAAPSQKPLPLPQGRPSNPTTPTLGRGLSEGDDIFFDLSPPPPPSTSQSAAKMAALRKLKAKGASLSRDDPNAVKRKRASSDDIATRVEKNRSSPEGDRSAAGEEEEPAQKKRRAQLDYIQSEEFQKLLNAKSQFTWLMGEMEVKAMQDYFEPLVQKEQLEEKMRSIREQKCRAVTCKTCKYTHFKPADRCVQENHDYHWHDAHKRFFKCTCGQRKISLARIPNVACSNCGQFKWERDGMLKEKNGPKIGGELLLTRGDEQPKFLSSMK